VPDLAGAVKAIILVKATEDIGEPARAFFILAGLGDSVGRRKLFRPRSEDD